MKRYIRSAVVDILDESDDVRREVSRTTDNLRLIRKLAKSSDKSVMYDLTRNPNTPGDILESIYDSGIWEDYYHGLMLDAIAHNPNTPPTILEKIIKSGHSVSYVLSNKNCSADLLRKYSKSVDDYYKQRIARNPNTPTDVLVDYMDTKSLYCHLAANPSFPAEYLSELITQVSGRWADEVAFESKNTCCYHEKSKYTKEYIVEISQRSFKSCARGH